MKHIKKYFLFVLIMGSFSCSEDLLDLYPKTQITEGNFYQDEEQLILAVDDIYRQLGRIYNAQGIADLYGELRSDNTYIEFTGGATTFSEEISDYYIRTNNGLLENAWETSYNAIFICNNAIYQLENSEVQFTDPNLR
ncbi:MAG: RagB/SusD family nutrient uptake outer membrane protein, partial [Cyclobacteriaceae bacterium]